MAQHARRQGQKHVDNAVRQFEDAQNEYLKRWDLLGLQASLLPNQMKRLSDKLVLLVFDTLG